jgi:hypothetical protein
VSPEPKPLRTTDRNVSGAERWIGRVQATGQCLWLAALALAIPVSVARVLIYPVVALAVAGGVLVAGCQVAKGWFGVEPAPEPSPDHAPKGPPAEADEPRPSFWKAFLGRFLDQL